MIELSGLPAERIFSAATLREQEVIEAIAALDPEIGVSVLFGYILKPALLERLGQGPDHEPYRGSDQAAHRC